MSLDSVRYEFESLDPLSSPAEPAPIADVNIDEGAIRTKGGRRQKDIRAASRDMPKEMQLYVGELIGKHEYCAGDRNGIPRWHCPDAVLFDLANLLNIRMDWIHDAWNKWRAGKRVPPEARARCEKHIATLRALRPIRHLIAFANKPDDIEEGELEAAVEMFGAVVPSELKTAIPDIALMEDLADQIREIGEKVLRQLFAYYEKRVDETGTVRTLVVNYTRSHTMPLGIYPPGIGGRRHDAKERS